MEIYPDHSNADVDSRQYVRWLNLALPMPCSYDSLLVGKVPKLPRLGSVGRVEDIMHKYPVSLSIGKSACYIKGKLG